MSQWVVLLIVSLILWVVVAYAYWYSIKKTYGMRAERQKRMAATKKSKDESENEPNG